MGERKERRGIHKKKQSKKKRLNRSECTEKKKRGAKSQNA